MRYEVGVYRAVTHYQTVFIEAESNDQAHELASQGASSNVPDHRNTGWRHQRTEFRVMCVQRDPTYRPPADACNDGASVDAGGEGSRPDVAVDTTTLPGFD